MMQSVNTHQTILTRHFPTRTRLFPFSSVQLAAVALFALALLLAGCGTTSVSESLAPTAGPPIIENRLIDDLADYVAPTPTPEPEAEQADEAAAEDAEDEAAQNLVVVNTQGARANLRSAPTLDAEIIGKGNPGTIWQIISASEDGEWYQICCLEGANDAEGQATTPAWVASSVVTATTGVADFALPAESVGEPLLADGMEARWEVDWACGSDRCAVSECTATVTATADSPNQQYLQVEHGLVWEDGCFEEDSWIFEVDRYSGEERTGDFVNNFLYSYWIGGEPGEANGVYRYDDDLGIAVWCSEPSDVEIEEGDGWTSVYEGSTCHDIKSGALVLLEYTKRWLYTGEYDGTTYNRSYFGDSETLEQRLVETNIDMAFMQQAE